MSETTTAAADKNRILDTLSYGHDEIYLMK